MLSEREDRGSIDPIIDILAFFAAMKSYGYLDALGNALERVTALEALGNALRDFLTTCINTTVEAKEKLEREEGVKCPTVNAKDLEKAMESFNKITIALEERGELVTFLREVYVKALSRSLKFKIQNNRNGESL